MPINPMMWYGDEIIFPDLPDGTRVLKPPEPLPVLRDAAAKVREALEDPIDHEPLSKLVDARSRVTIAFDDCAYPIPPMRKPDARELIIGVLLEELYKLGVEKNNITLLCANGLHRKWTRRELSTILGKRIVSEFGPHQLYCHDAEDRDNLIYLGLTPSGYETEVNRLALDSDQLIYVNVTWAPMNGGWKSIAVGLGTWRSIRHHHNPDLGAHGVSQMDPDRSGKHAAIREQGELISRAMAARGRRPFQIETALINTMPYQLAAVFAGYPPAVHRRTMEVVERQYVIDVEGQTDVGLWGCPNTDPYSQLSMINPILVANLALGYSFALYQNKPVVREGGVAILMNPLKEQFDDIRHPSYREFYEKVLPRTTDPFEIRDLYEEDYAHRPEYIYKYRYAYAFHGIHPIILWGNTMTFPRRYLKKVIFAGVEDPAVAERLGFHGTRTLDEALKLAAETVGRDFSMTYHPLPPLLVARVH